MYNHILPLLSPSTATTTGTPATPATPTNSSIIVRLSFLVVIALLSLWANHEASKGFAITVLNESAHTSLGSRFHLFYISNDEATRILLKASTTVENFFYPPGTAKKPVRHIILRLSSLNSTAHDDISVAFGPDNEFVLELSSRVMEKPDFKEAVVSALHRGMTRVWLWDGPPNLINGIIEYMTIGIGRPARLARVQFSTHTTCWNDSDPEMVADFLRYGEGRMPGLVRRLNRQAVGGGWDNDDGILQNICTEYGETLRYNHYSV